MPTGCARLERESDDEPSGAALFRTNCAPCHGLAGHGDGPVAEVLFNKPADLTKIEASEGWFPDALVQMIIDGRYASHGRREMPVWGNRLSRKELRALTDYLSRIQE